MGQRVFVGFSVRTVDAFRRSADAVNTRINPATNDEAQRSALVELAGFMIGFYCWDCDP
jgi:hypothetical protein